MGPSLDLGRNDIKVAVDDKSWAGRILARMAGDNCGPARLRL